MPSRKSRRVILTTSAAPGPDSKHRPWSRSYFADWDPELHLRRSHDTRVDQLVNVEAGLYLTANLDVRCPFSTCSTTMATTSRIFLRV